MSAIDFLKQVPVLTRFGEAPNSDRHLSVPQDWELFISDVQDSTRAIQEGRYREVNLLGVASISAVLHAAGEQPVPYIFGGDGATFLVPPYLVRLVSQALVATRRLAREGFSLTLRVGRVPLSDLAKVSGEVRVARLQVSPHLSTWILSGQGLTLAETWVKTPPPGHDYSLADSSSSASGNYSGLECRWEPVPSRQGEILSLLVRSLSTDSRRAEKTYDQILTHIAAIYGDQSNGNPISEERLHLQDRFSSYSREATVRSHGRGRLRHLGHWIHAYFVTVLFGFLWQNLLKRFGDHYKADLVRNSDFRKFDGMLRMILDGSPAQHDRLTAYLEPFRQRAEIAYGVHRSKSALVTCLIFDRLAGNHLHFVDGNDGGYAEAARAMKAQLGDLSKKVA